MYYLKAGWPARSESISSCHERLEEWASDIARLDALLVNWYESTEEAEDPGAVAVEANWQRMLEEGRIDDELGSVIAAWAGSEDGYGLTLHCGVTVPLLPNQLHLSTPPDGGFVNDTARCQEALTRTAQIWSPHYVTISDSSFGLAIEVESDGFQSGWMNCVMKGSDRFARMRRLGWEEMADFDDYVVFSSAESVADLAASTFADWSLDG